MPDVIVDLPETGPQFRLVRAGSLEPRPMAWQVQSLFERDTLLLIVGDPSAGKSFWMLDLASCIATGIEHHERNVKQGPVIYIAGEGHNGIARRLKAWQIRNETSLEDAPLYVSTMPASIGDPVNTGAALQAIEATGENPSLVVLDTLNRNMAGNENDTADMRAFVHCCDEIRAAFNCTVALVHHTGHGDKSRARGSSVLHGAIDTTYMVNKDPCGIVSVECTRMKDGPIPEPFAFAFRTVELGLENEDGTEATSAVLHPCGVPEKKPKAQGKRQKRALEILRELEHKYRANLTASGHDPDGARVRLDDWRQACTDTGMPRRSFYSARDSLRQSGEVQFQTGGYVRPTDRDTT